ncbi:MAG TPA: zeta toxin family protein [Rheinheimera sp.]|uniref:zeta toxin family protein n=1 Tax=Rheinheimera sp. TaxID=1869214 RepID=UPI002F9490CF
MSNKPILYLIAGPNGAGKSTLYQQVLKPKVQAPFINADLIQKTELSDQSMAGAYAAAKLAAQRRAEYLTLQHSFVTESTFSHPSKLDLLQQARATGFIVMVFHVGVAAADLSVQRVALRVTEGGHDVPEDKIRDRFARNKALIRQAVLQADLGLVYDNSLLNRKPVLLFSFQRGQLSQRVASTPWAFELYGV